MERGLWVPDPDGFLEFFRGDLEPALRQLTPARAAA